MCYSARAWIGTCGLPLLVLVFEVLVFIIFSQLVPFEKAPAACFFIVVLLLAFKEIDMIII